MLSVVSLVVNSLWGSRPMPEHVWRFSEDRGLNPMLMRVRQWDNRLLLWGNDEYYFDISNAIFDPEMLTHGRGRLTFPAVRSPDFVEASEANWMKPETEVLAVHIGGDVRVYSKMQLTMHEVVNDRIDDRDVLIAFCPLANLGAVYDRNVNGEVLTFGVSGYTYAEYEVWDGQLAFLLWDVESESLWWPPIGKAVAGQRLHEPMRVLDEELWAQTTWGAIQKKYPSARVMGWVQADLVEAVHVNPERLEAASQAVRNDDLTEVVAATTQPAGVEALIGEQREYLPYFLPFDRERKQAVQESSDGEPIKVAPRWGANRRL